MRLGLNIGYSGARMDLPLDLIQEADRLGYHALWTSEAYGSDCVTPLAWVGALTKNIKLGSGIMQMPARSPAMTAMTAMTLDQLSGGRVLLGLGLSGPQVVEGWHGRPYGKPLAKTREYIAIVRRILERDAPLDHSGEHYQIPYAGQDATGLGKPLKSILHGRADMPIYLAAIGPKNVQLSAEIADGWLPMLFSPARYQEAYGAAVAAGLAKAGKTRRARPFDIAPAVSVVIDDELEAAYNQIKPALALYIGGMGAKGKNFYYDLACRYGFEGAASEIQAHYLQGQKGEAIMSVPDALVDEVALVGPEARIRDRLQLWRDSPITTLNAAVYFAGRPALPGGRTALTIDAMLATKTALTPLRIGDIHIGTPLLLAPMAGHTNYALRRLCRQLGGCGLVCTELISSSIVKNSRARALQRFDWRADERPVAVQLFGVAPQIVAEAARVVVDHGADIVDINMGCWVPKIAKKGGGAALLRDVEAATAVVEAVVKAVDAPVTVKVRSGFEDGVVTAVPFAMAAEAVGAKAVAVHARFAGQGHGGEADWEVIAAVKDAVRDMPIIGNGDVHSGADARRMLEATGCDGVMIGRAALGRPWLFQQVATYLDTGVALPEPSRAERALIALRHARLTLETTPLPERVAVLEMRGQISKYQLDAPGSRRLRNRLVRIESFAELESILLGVACESK